MVAGGTTASAGGWHGREHQGCKDAVSGVPFWAGLSHRGAFPQLLALPLNNCSEDSWKSLQGPPRWKSQEKGQSARGASLWPAPPLEKS